MSKISIAILFTFFYSILLSGQDIGKKQMTPEVFEEWREIKQTKISNDGEWISYVNYHEKIDPILILFQSSENKKYIFSRADNAMFSEDNNFVVFNIHPAKDSIRALKRKKVKEEKLPKDSLCILRLSDQFHWSIPRVNDFLLPKYWNGHVIISQQSLPKEEKDSTKYSENSLLVWDLSSARADTITFLDKYKIAEREPGLIVSTIEQDSLISAGIFNYNFSDKKIETVFQQKGKYEQLAISPNGDKLAFLFDQDTSKIYHRPYDLYHWDKQSKSCKKLSSNLPAFGKNEYRLSEHGNIVFSRSGNRLFFGISKPDIEPDTTLLEEEIVDVEVWTSRDERTYPQQLITLEKDKEKTLSAFYDYEEQRCIQVGEEHIDGLSYQKEMDNNFALAYDESPGKRAMSWEGFPIRKNIFKVDLNTGNKTLLEENLAGSPQLSPQGKYICYYNRTENAWYANDLKKNKRFKLAGEETTQFDYELHDLPIDAYDYGYAGWTEEDNRFLVYDRYDIWQLDPAGKHKPINLSRGRDKKVIHRLIKLDREDNFFTSEENWLIHFQNEDDRSEGYKIFDPLTGKMKTLIEGSTAYQKIPIQARDKNRLVFHYQNFQIFPDLQLADEFDFSNLKRISDINPQQSEYLWGTIESFSWKDYLGNKVKGMLVKPDNFDPTKKHPLLINFYERSSDRIHRYPKLFPHRSTINYAYYANRGYVIFNPDVSYIIGSPGESAYRAVMSGVDALLESGFIDEKKMGLQGHSWGGYQVAYLLTRTNRFRCAESGAPVVNMTSAYGGIRWRSGLSRMFQYEKTQSRLGTTLWKDQQRYLDNSPLFELDQMETPVLILHNDKDGAVPWYQGIEYFMALRRLNKPAWFLNYTGEPHWPVKRQNREDFQLRMSQFFDHFLKDQPKPRWMLEGVPALTKGIDQALELLGKE